MSKSLKILFTCLFVFAMFLLCVGTLSISTSYTDRKLIEYEVINKNLKNKVDSLENILNISYKEKRDTIIVNLYPKIKIYQNEHYSREENHQK